MELTVTSTLTELQLTDLQLPKGDVPVLYWDNNEEITQVLYLILSLSCFERLLQVENITCADAERPALLSPQIYMVKWQTTLGILILYAKQSFLNQGLSIQSQYYYLRQNINSHSAMHYPTSETLNMDVFVN